MAKIGRNRPCPCGSGKKFKKCCIDKDAAPAARAFDPERDAVFQKKLREMEAERVQREKQQGLGRGIISAEMNGYRIVCVGNQVHYSRSWKTFHDFLRDYLINKLGRDWFRGEQAKPDKQRHPIVQWFEQASADWKKLGIKPGEVTPGPMTGAQRAFLNLAYNIYLIAHHPDSRSSDALLATFVDKLKSARMDDFIGKLFETYAAAAFLKAGFTLRYENEGDKNISHVEFVATYPKTKKRFSVEVKSRNRSHDNDDDGPVDDVKRLRVGNKLNKALGKAAEYVRVAMIEINIPDLITEKSLQGWPQAALDQVRHAEKDNFPDGTPKPSAYVIISNHAFHNNLPTLDVGAQAIAVGFRIPDFGPDIDFHGYKAVLDSRERHLEMFALLDSMKTHYEIPATFDGENPELAFLPQNDLPRLKFGEWYRVRKGDGTEVPGRLYEATVIEQEKKVFGAYETSTGEHLIVTVPISDAELAAYRKHPDTFFGEVRHVGARAETFLDLCDFFYASYKNTPRERLLEFLKNAPDFAQLKELSQKELAITCCERWAQSAFNDATKEQQ
jgi:hypothetical protein